MAKTKTTFVCQSCGTHHAKWMGRCSACGEWNSVVEEIQTQDKESVPSFTKGAIHPVLLKDISNQDVERIQTNSNELNRVLGGGIVPGSLILLGGEPGIGKSTLLLQMALKMRSQSILYISGEESERQIKLRADRIYQGNELLQIYTETSIEKIVKTLKDIQPSIVIVDSIQTVRHTGMESTPGSVSQIRECTNILMRFAKQTNTTVFIVGHITKDGQIAGPKLLEHMVDVVLQFEGDRNYNFRLLRGLKNRFGATSELGIYEMAHSGLKEVPNPSSVFISEKETPMSGSAIGVTIEGNRPILIETQALVSPAAYGTPQRSAIGIDGRRLNMLLAILEKRGNFKWADKDVFLNIVGGLKVEDTAMDLAIIASLFSSEVDIPLPSDITFAAEVGLAGEIRPVAMMDRRISEAEKLGFTKIYGSKGSKLDKSFSKIKFVPIDSIHTFFQSLVQETG